MTAPGAGQPRVTTRFSHWNLQTLNGKDERALANYLIKKDIAVCGFASTRLHEFCAVHSVQATRSNSEYLFFFSNFHRGFVTNRYGVAIAVSRHLLALDNGELYLLFPDENKPAEVGKTIKTHRNFSIHWFDQSSADRFIRIDIDLGQGRRLAILELYAPENSAASDEKDRFYARLSEELEDIARSDPPLELVLLGDFNAHVGWSYPSTIGHFALIEEPPPKGNPLPSEANDNGERLLTICLSYGLILCNNSMYVRPDDKWTWRSLSHSTSGQTSTASAPVRRKSREKPKANLAQKDFIIVRQQNLFSLLDFFVEMEHTPYKGEHRLITASLQFLPGRPCTIPKEKKPLADVSDEVWDPWKDPVRFEGCSEALFESLADEERILEELRAVKTAWVRAEKAREIETQCQAIDDAVRRVRSTSAEVKTACTMLEMTTEENNEEDDGSMPNQESLLAELAHFSGAIRDRSAQICQKALEVREKTRVIQRTLTESCATLLMNFIEAVTENQAAQKPRLVVLLLFKPLTLKKGQSAAEFNERMEGILRTWLGVPQDSRQLLERLFSSSVSSESFNSSEENNCKPLSRIFLRLFLEALMEDLRDQDIAVTWCGRMQFPRRGSGRFTDCVALTDSRWDILESSINHVTEKASQLGLEVDNSKSTILVLGKVSQDIWEQTVYDKIPETLSNMDRLCFTNIENLWSVLLNRQIATSNETFHNTKISLWSHPELPDERKANLFSAWMGSMHRNWWRPLIAASGPNPDNQRRQLDSLIKCVNFILSQRPVSSTIRRLHAADKQTLSQCQLVRFPDHPPLSLLHRLLDVITECLSLLNWESDETRSGFKMLRRVFERNGVLTFLPTAVNPNLPLVRPPGHSQMETQLDEGLRLPPSIPSLQTAVNAQLVLNAEEIESVRPGCWLSDRLITFILSEVCVRASGYLTQPAPGRHERLTVSVEVLNNAHTILLPAGGALFIARLDTGSVTCVDPHEIGLSSERQEFAAGLAVDLEAATGKHFRLVAPPRHSICGQEEEGGVFCVLYVDHLVCRRRMDSFGLDAAIQWRYEWLHRTDTLDRSPNGN